MRHSGFDSYPGSGIRQNLGKGCRIGKENDIRDSGDRRSARGILVKKGRECGISTLPISRPYEGRILATSTESDHLPVFVGHLAWLRHVSKFTLYYDLLIYDT